MFNIQITSLVKKQIEPYIKEGHIAVDLTAGNGNDTCFLAEKIGVSGKVYAFDIQKLAIERTREKLNDEKLLNRVELIHDNHENLDNYINGKVNIGMMNLGYLPNGDKTIVTTGESTIKAIEKVIEKLDRGGILSIILYHGHEGGQKEKVEVEDYLKNVDERSIEIITISYLNRNNYPPIIYLIYKR